jgi:hypothetical protein
VRAHDPGAARPAAAPAGSLSAPGLERAVELRVAGLSFAQIGKKLGISKARADQLVTRPPPLAPTGDVDRTPGAARKSLRRSLGAPGKDAASLCSATVQRTVIPG